MIDGLFVSDTKIWLFTSGDLTCVLHINEGPVSPPDIKDQMSTMWRENINDQEHNHMLQVFPVNLNTFFIMIYILLSWNTDYLILSLYT